MKKLKKLLIKNSDGNTMVMVIIYSWVLLGLAASVLMVSTYQNYKSVEREEVNQLRLYAEDLSKRLATTIVLKGEFNNEIATRVLDVTKEQVGTKKELGSSYVFRYENIAEMTNPFNNQKVQLDIDFNYKPQTLGGMYGTGVDINPGISMYERGIIHTGDKLVLVFHITVKGKTQSFMAEYVCMKDESKNENGTYVAGFDPGNDEAIKKFKWEIKKYEAIQVDYKNK